MLRNSYHLQISQLGCEIQQTDAAVAGGAQLQSHPPSARLTTWWKCDFHRVYVFSIYNDICSLIYVIVVWYSTYVTRSPWSGYNISSQKKKSAIPKNDIVNLFAPSSEGIHFQTYITAILVIAASAFLHQPFILVTPGDVQVLSLTAHVAKMWRNVKELAGRQLVEKWGNNLRRNQVYTHYSSSLMVMKEWLTTLCSKKSPNRTYWTDPYNNFSWICIEYKNLICFFP